MKFSSDQLEAINIRHKNVVVSASAGSGKTSVLVERLCQLVIKDHISIDSILAMTFTNDAAAEMKVRLRSRLLQEEPTDYIQSQIALLETANISTIDSFCLSIVKNYYYQIPISYTMANQTASSAQTQEAFEKGYQRALEIVEPKDWLQYASTFHIKDEDILRSIRSLIAIAYSKPDPIQWFSDIQTENKEIEQWFYQYFLQRFEAIKDLCEYGVSLHEFYETKKERLKPCIDACSAHDYDRLYQSFPVYYAQVGYLNTRSIKENKEEIKAINKEIKAYEEQIAKVLLPKEEYETNSNVKKKFCALCLETKKQFEEIKREMEIIDFSDMESFAYQLLQIPMIKEEVTNQFEAILIDEFQDTNDLQESIISCIARQDNVFRVGDIKQSIYGFRQAKPDIMRQHMEIEDAFHTTLVMDKNFRSNRSVIEFNNDFYQKIMNTDLLGHHFEDIDIAHVGAEYQEKNPQFPIRFLYSEADAWAIENDEKKVTARSKFNKNKMDVIAHDILAHHDRGVAFKDICILTRTHSPQKELAQVLEAYGIPVVSDLDNGYYTNSAIQIVLATMQSLVDPNNDIALCACLLSDIGKVSTQQLTQACLGRQKNTSLYKTIKDEPFMANWNELYTIENQKPSQWLQKIYAQNDFYVSYCTRQDRTNLDYLLELSTQFDDLNSFLQQLSKDAPMDSVAEAFGYGKEDDVVSIKTMHHSKGLQFPIVYIFSQSNGGGTTNTSSIYMDSDLGIEFKHLSEDGKLQHPSKGQLAIETKKKVDELQEEMRVFYVATTRAQSELILVDSIHAQSDYALPLNTHTLLMNRSYTSWIFHTYFHDPHSLVQFEKSNELYERPMLKRENRTIEKPKMYEKKSQVFSNVTASQKKKTLAWKPFERSTNQATNRGSMFHEIMATSYPYRENDIKKVADRYRYKMSQTDMKQILALNENTLYQDWMSNSHQFELSYISQEGDQVIHGFIDFVCWKGDDIIIVDYKTDHVEDTNELKNLYKSQLDTYKEALQKMYPTKNIYTYIYSFHLCQIVDLN